MNTESILGTIKKMLNVHPDEKHFDQDIIVGINSAFMVLNDLGVGPDNTFYITDDTAVWNDFTRGGNEMNSIQTVIYLRTRLIFDPPANGFVAEAMERQIDELEWRLRIRSEFMDGVNGPNPEPEVHDKTFIFTQSTPSREWVIEHDLNKYPSVTVVDHANNEVKADISYLSPKEVIVRFTESHKGHAYLN